MAKDTPDLRKQLESFDMLPRPEQLRVLRELDRLMDDWRDEAIRLCSGTTIQLEDVPRLIQQLLLSGKSDHPAEAAPERKHLQQFVKPRYVDQEIRQSYFQELMKAEPDLYEELCQHLRVQKLVLEDIPHINGYTYKSTYTYCSSPRGRVTGDGADAYYFHTNTGQPVAIRFSVEKSRRKGNQNFIARLDITDLFTNQTLSFFHQDPVTSVHDSKGNSIVQGSDERYCLSSDFVATKLHELAAQDSRFAQWDPEKLLEKEREAGARAQEAIKNGGDQWQEYDKAAKKSPTTLGSLSGGEGFVRVFKELPLEENIVRFVKSGDLARLLEDPRSCSLSKFDSEPKTHTMPFSGKSRK